MTNPFSLTLATLLAMAPALATAQTSATAAARVAAGDWLSKLDAADYPATWGSAAAVFKAAISVQGWQQAAQSARQPLGGLRNRVEQSTTFTRTLPGVADGPCVVLQYRAAYDNQALATETVTAKLEADGSWKVAGYFIQ